MKKNGIQNIKIISFDTIMMKLKCVTNSLTDHGLLVLELLSQLIISFSALALLQFIISQARSKLYETFKNFKSSSGHGIVNQETPVYQSAVYQTGATI